MAELPTLDPVIHAPVRLAIMSALLGVEEMAFTTLRDHVGATDGNLASHLGRLEKAGYVQVHKEFLDRKPHTRLALTDEGRDAFAAYLDALQSMLPQL